MVRTERGSLQETGKEPSDADLAADWTSMPVNSRDAQIGRRST